MEVPDLRAVLPNFETSLPQQDLLPPSVREPEASRPVSARYTLQSACQSPRRSEADRVRSGIPYEFKALAEQCQCAFRGRQGSGEARCHPVRGNARERVTHTKRKRGIAFAAVTPGVTLHAAVTRA